MSGFVKLYAAVTQTKPIMRLVRYYQFIIIINLLFLLSAESSWA